MDECKPLVHGMWEMAVKREHLADFPPDAFEPIVAGRGFADFQGTSNGGRQFLRNRRSNRHIVPLYGKSDGLFT